MALLKEAALDDPWLGALSRAVWAKPEFSMLPLDYRVVPRQAYRGPRLSRDGLRVVFCGIPSDYGTGFLLHLLARRANVCAVVCSTRWQRTHPTADLLARIAGHVGRPVEVVQNVNAEAFRNCLNEYAPDVVVMASFDQIITAPTLSVPRLGWINVHPSCLPRHRGPEPIYWTIMGGDAEAGITLHWAVPRIDAGPILAQRTVAVRPDDTSGSLARRLVEAGLPALDETLERLQAGDLSAREFDFREAVWGGIRNLAIRLLALPFSRVGSLFFSEDSKVTAVTLAPVVFERGTARLGPAMVGHLERVAAFLLEAPSVSLRLAPILTQADLDALKRELATEELPTDALRDLGARRLDVVRQALTERGRVDTGRLAGSSRRVPLVEAAGAARVELDLRP